MLTVFEKIGNSIYEARHQIATAVVVILMVVLGYRAIFGENGLLMYEKKREMSRELSVQNQTLNQENAVLEQQIKGLKSDPKMIEKEAREHLRYARPGEVIYTIPNNGTQVQPAKK